MNLALPPQLTDVVSRLPAAPPSLAFSMVANRLLWPALKSLDWQALLGRRYAIRVKDMGLSLRFTATPRGFAPDSGVPDLTISASARDFLLLLSRREDHDSLFFSRRLVSEGEPSSASPSRTCSTPSIPRQCCIVCLHPWRGRRSD